MSRWSPASSLRRRGSATSRTSMPLEPSASRAGAPIPGSSVRSASMTPTQKRAGSLSPSSSESQAKSRDVQLRRRKDGTRALDGYLPSLGHAARRVVHSVAPSGKIAADTRAYAWRVATETVSVLIDTKLNPPVLRDAVDRPRLVRALAGSVERVKLIRAPAGWGKSTLVAAWSRSPGEPRPFAWLALDESDDEPIRF